MSPNCFIFRRAFDAPYTSNIDIIIPNFEGVNIENKCDIIIDFDNTIIEIPLFSLNNISSNLSRVINSNRIIIPLDITDNVQVKTTNKFFKESFRENSKISRLVTSKGEIFYGTKGLILDKDFNVLILSTYIISRESFVKDKIVVIKDINFYVNSKILYEKNFISSTIIKDIIPYISSLNLDWVDTPYTIRSRNDIKPTVIIKNDFSKYIIKPSKPKNINMNKEINEMLNNCIEEIIIHNA